MERRRQPPERATAASVRLGGSLELHADLARDAVARIAAELARDGDVVFTMGCGDVYRTCPLLLEELR